MIDFLKRLFGLEGQKPQTAPPETQNAAPKAKPKPKPKLDPVPSEVSEEFLSWFTSHRQPAIALKPDPELPIAPTASRLFGPAFLLENEDWPIGSDGETLDFLAQLNLADCAQLEGYPASGIVQFFVGRDDLFGANFDDLLAGNFLVRLISADAKGTLHEAPHKDTYDRSGIDDCSPSYDYALRLRGIALVPELIEDTIDVSHYMASQRFFALAKKYDVDPLYDTLDELEAKRSNGHHTGGYPAFIQADIREYGEYGDYDHTLLRLTSDKYLMWGDVGECVFMMRGADLKKGDFSRVVYSWDCG